MPGVRSIVLNAQKFGVLPKVIRSQFALDKKNTTYGVPTSIVMGEYLKKDALSANADRA